MERDWEGGRRERRREREMMMIKFACYACHENLSIPVGPIG